MHGLALLLTLHFGGDPKPADRWLAPDKARHFFLSVFVESMSFSVLRSAGVGRNASLVGASALTAGLGAGREIYDHFHPGTPSVKDLAWDGIGIAAAAVVLHQTAP
jgi:uncharacterized protein YfiM (DUF2279 family)